MINTTPFFYKKGASVGKNKFALKMLNNVFIEKSSFIADELKYWIPSSIRIFTLIKKIRDPEFPYFLYVLNIITIEKILIENYILNQNINININVAPTYNMCTMSSIIGLSIENIIYNEYSGLVLKNYFPINWNWKYCITILPAFHIKGLTITKQLNDKERISAAIENFSIRNIVKFSYYKPTK